jgi:hypothetical protein
MLHKNTCYKKRDNLQIREVPETDTYLVFAPNNTNLYSLNLSTRLIFELCNGESRECIENNFLESVASILKSKEAKSYFDEGFDSLLNEEIVELVEFEDRN